MIIFNNFQKNKLAAKARAIAEGYCNARADSRHPGDAVVQELEEQLRVLWATTGKCSGLL